MSILDRGRDFDLTCWYLNKRRVAELVGMDAAAGPPFAGGQLDDHMRELAIQVHFKDCLTEWVKGASPPTLGELVVKGEAVQGAVFTHFHNYIFKGLPAVSRALYRGLAQPPLAEAYAKLDGLKPGLIARFKFSHEHLTSNSSWAELSGQKPVLVFGIISDTTEAEITVVPYVIAYPFIHFADGRASVIGRAWHDKLEAYIDQIDQFVEVRNFDRPRTPKALDVLRSIPEDDVKHAFAEIIGEPTVRKDWGGEQSDLFTSRVEIAGQRMTTAFAFKGPSKFHPMTVADLGKNGDQIGRLFSEPAELMVLQHCHEITPAVRSTMRAFAQRMGQLRLFCLIDGYDTLRIFNAYKKCGLGGTLPSRGGSEETSGE